MLKIRNLENGRFYATKKNADKGLEFALRVNPDQIMACTAAGQEKEVLERRGRSFSKFCKKNPGFMSENRRRMYRNNRGLHRVRSISLKENRELMGLPTTDAAMMDLIVKKGKETIAESCIVEYVLCERDKSVGVVEIVELESEVDVEGSGVVLG